MALCLVMGLVCLSAVGGVYAQMNPTNIQTLSPASQAAAGIELVQANRVEEALPLLKSAVQADTALIVPELGAASYWLGRAYAKAEQPGKAETVWRTGMHALRGADGFDVRLADAYLSTLTPMQLRGERLQAVDVYRSLVEEVGTDTTAQLEHLQRRRVAQIAPLMPDEVFNRVIKEDRSTSPGAWTLQPEASSALAEWMGGLDPLPTTPENERLEEHLTRLVHVQRQYGCTERASGLDARGLVYLRFGAPYKRRPIDYENGEFLQEVFVPGVSVTASAFPDSEIWLYTHIDRSGFYLFAESDTSDCYVKARANDLIPPHLTMRRGNTNRGLNIAYSALMAMRAIYRELALYHPNFSGRYSEIANYAGWQEMRSSMAQAAQMAQREYFTRRGEQMIEVTGGPSGTRRIFASRMYGVDYPTDFVPRMVARAEREDRAAAKRREESMPRQYTALLEGSTQLPVAVRTARFLNDDGTTRTEVYWGLPTRALALGQENPAASTLTFSAVLYDRDHSTRQRKFRRFDVPKQAAKANQMVIPPPTVLNKSSDIFHVGLQWEQYQRWPTDSTTGGVGLGPKRRMATARADSLKPLRTNGLEMSDVKVLSRPATAPPARTVRELNEKATPYPFRALTVERPLLLSFEVYQLAFNDEQRTRYTVSYEVRGRTDRGWTGLFRGEDTQRTSTEMTTEGTERRTEETILLDLAEIERDESQDVRVTVRVTDEVTGATVSRNIDFRLRPSPSNTQ